MLPPPDSSDYIPHLSPSISENIDALAGMLMGNSLSFQKESCKLLLDKIKEKITINLLIEEALERLEQIIEEPDAYEPATIQQTLRDLRGIE